MDAKKRKEAKAIGRRILKLRTGQGLSQRQLAAGTRISAVYICRIEKGDRLPSLEVLIELASALGVPVTSFPYRKRALAGISDEELIYELRWRGWTFS